MGIITNKLNKFVVERRTIVTTIVMLRGEEMVLLTDACYVETLLNRVEMYKPAWRRDW